MFENLQILLATDFSQNSKPALEVYKLLQRQYKIQLTLIHVVVSFWANWFASGDYEKEALQRLSLWQKKFLGESDPKKIKVLVGNPAENIITFANQHTPDLILLGIKNIKKSRYRTNDTAENVVRYVEKSSVLICKTTSISRVLCGIDGSPHSAKALKEAINFCRRFRAELHIVSVLPPVDFNPLGLSEVRIKKEENIFRKKYVVKIQPFLNKFKLSGIKVKKHFLWGLPAEVILDLAEDLDVDMIVLGAKGHSALHHIFIGSTTEKVLAYIPCSLLVVR